MTAGTPLTIKNPIHKMQRFTMAVAMKEMVLDHDASAADRAAILAITPLISEDSFEPQAFIDTMQRVKEQEKDLLALKLPKLPFYAKPQTIGADLLTKSNREALESELRYAQALVAVNTNGLETPEQTYVAEYLRHANAKNYDKPQAVPVLPVTEAQVMAEAFRGKKYVDAKEYAQIAGEEPGKHEALMHVVKSFSESAVREGITGDTHTPDEGTRIFLKHWQFNNSDAINLMTPLLREAAYDAASTLGVAGSGVPAANATVAAEGLKVIRTVA